MEIVLFALAIAFLINYISRKPEVVKEECKIHEWAYSSIPPHQMICNKCNYVAGS